MEIVVFEKESFYKMLEELTIRNFETAKKYFEKEEWISTDEAKKILGVKSKGKLQQMRDNFEIEFSQFGKIIRYSRSSIYRFLEQNRVSIDRY